MTATPPVQAACEPSPWTLSADHSVAASAGTRLNLTDASTGLIVDEGVQVLGLRLPAGCGPVEAWARGADLTAVYEPSDERQLRITAMWRLGPASPATSDIRWWQMVLSSQTSLLTSSAELAVLSTIRGEHATVAGRWTGETVAWEGPSEQAATCLQVNSRTTEGRTRSVVIAIHPDDPGAIDQHALEDGSLQVCCRLFPSNVEKGVLLRSRILVALGPDAPPQQAAGDWSANLLRQFAWSPPVLTA